MIIRLEQPSDYPGIHAVNLSGFATPAEAKLVDELRIKASPVISLVAEEDGVIKGHILFSPVTLSGHADLKIMGLGPVAVQPEFQRQGVGSALIHEGLKRCAGLEYGAVCVLGHANYYPRFGFIPSVNYGIRCEYDVPEEVFMVRELIPGYLTGSTGVIQYHPAFNNV